MSNKKQIKTVWVDCEQCGCSITANDRKIHVDLKCTKDQVKCPFIENNQLHSVLERSATHREGSPKDSVMIHPSAGTLLGAVIGGPLELKREGVPPLVRRMWPSRASAPSAVILPVASLTGGWCSDGNKAITVSVLQSDVYKASTVTCKILNHKSDEDISDILKDYFLNTYVCIGSVLVYYYFGKKLKIEVLNVKTDINKNAGDNHWYILSSETKWNMPSENINQKVKKKPNDLGGVNDIIEEINTFIDISFCRNGVTANFQPTRGVLLYGSSGTGKSAICRHLTETANCFSVDITGPSVFKKFFGETELAIENLFKKAVENEPSIIIVDEIETICPKTKTNSTEQERRVTSAFVNLVDNLHEERSRVFIIATTRSPDAIDPMLRRFGRLDKEIEVPVPDRLRRREILYALLKSLPHKISENDIESISQLAHGYVAADLVNLCTQASMKCIKRKGELLEKEDLNGALTIVRPSAMRELLVEVPNVRWTDIGGQDNLKLKLRQAVEWPIKYTESFKRLGIRPPSGVLLYGPPGCSKTMIAKALATESGLNFLSIKGPELFSKYVGESERAVRNLFTKARQVAPSVIFFDEVDALGGERGSGNNGHINEMVLAQLLTELDGVVPLNSVTILAATNRPDRMDRALLRPGRLDRLIYVPLPDFETRLQIIELKLSKMSVSDDVNSHVIATKTEGYSGAELDAICHEAALEALEKDIYCTQVKMEHFEYILKEYKPRTPQSLLKIYENFALGQKSS